MIKKLQRRFIFVAMGAVVTVLTIIMAIINVSNYLDVISEADRTLSFIEENGGKFPRPSGEKQKPHIDGMSAEAPFETRFFAVFLDDEGKAVSANTGSIAAITTDVAITYAEKIYSSGSESGFLGVYRYSITDSDNGKMVTFVDCRKGLAFFELFLKTSLAVSLLGSLGVLIIVLLLSKRAIKPIADSYEKQKHFITDAGHELKTPLTVISANTEVLELTQGENEWTQSIRNQVNRLTELTNSLVSLARMDEHDSRLLMTDFSISDAVSESLDPFAQVANQQGKRVETAIQKNLSFEGNEEAIRKLVGILADNAIKYSGKEANIAVTLKTTNRGMLLQVKNSVDEISKGNHDEMFERFYRGDTSRNSEMGGYGIGLSIARAIVNAHKGRVTARSEDGKSLTISVML